MNFNLLTTGASAVGVVIIWLLLGLIVGLFIERAAMRRPVAWANGAEQFFELGVSLFPFLGLAGTVWEIATVLQSMGTEVTGATLAGPLGKALRFTFLGITAASLCLLGEFVARLVAPKTKEADTQKTEVASTTQGQPAPLGHPAYQAELYDEQEVLVPVGGTPASDLWNIEESVWLNVAAAMADDAPARSTRQETAGLNNTPNDMGWVKDDPMSKPAELNNQGSTSEVAEVGQESGQGEPARERRLIGVEDGARVAAEGREQN